MQLPYDSPRRIALPTLAVLAGIAAAAASGFVVRLILARALAPADLGRLVLAIAVASAVGGLAGLGAQIAATQRIAAAHAAGSPGRAAAAARTAFALALTGGAVASVVLGLAARPLAGWFGDPALAAPLRALAPCALGLAIGIGALGIARGHGDLFGRAALRDGGGGLMRVVAVAAAAAAGVGTNGVALAFGVTVLASELLFAVWVTGRGWLPLGAESGWDRTLVARLAPFAVLQLVQQGVQWFDTLALGWLAVPAAVGVYSVARGTARVLEMAAEAAAHRFLPAATMTLAREGSEGLGRMFAQTRAFVFCLLWPPLALCLLLPGELLARVFGAEYGAGGPSLRLLALALLLSALLGYPDKALLAAGQAGVTSRWTTLALLAGGTVAFLAIPRLGALGAAAGYATMALAQRVGQAASLRRRLGVTLFDRELPGTLLRTLPLPFLLLAVPSRGLEGDWWALVATGLAAGLGSLWALARLERGGRDPLGD